MTAVDPYGHIDLRVVDLATARPFYAALLPTLGFTREFAGEEWLVWATEGELPGAAYFAVTETPEHVATANRVVFRLPSLGDVDRVGAVVRASGGRIESGPRPCPEYSDTYYAVFFKDPSGNRLEAYFRTS